MLGNTNGFQKGCKNRLGAKHSKQSKIKIGENSARFWTRKKRKDFSESIMGNNNPNWKGDRAGYRALHEWIESIRGKPDRCDECGATEKPKKYKRFFCWVNLNHKYNRNVEEWAKMCVVCHGKYDVDNKLRKHKCVV